MHWMDDRKTASVDDFIYQWSTLHQQCWRMFKRAPTQQKEWSDGFTERPDGALDTDAAQARFENAPVHIYEIPDLTWGDIEFGIKKYNRGKKAASRGRPQGVDNKSLIHVGKKLDVDIDLRRKDDFRKGKSAGSWACLGGGRTLFQITDRQCGQDGDKCKKFVMHLANLYIASELSNDKTTLNKWKHVELQSWLDATGTAEARGEKTCGAKRYSEKNLRRKKLRLNTLQQKRPRRKRVLRNCTGLRKKSWPIYNCSDLALGTRKLHQRPRRRRARRRRAKRKR